MILVKEPPPQGEGWAYGGGYCGGEGKAAADFSQQPGVLRQCEKAAPWERPGGLPEAPSLPKAPAEKG